MYLSYLFRNAGGYGATVEPIASCCAYRSPRGNWSHQEDWAEFEEEWEMTSITRWLVISTSEPFYGTVAENDPVTQHARQHLDEIRCEGFSIFGVFNLVRRSQEDLGEIKNLVAVSEDPEPVDAVEAAAYHGAAIIAGCSYQDYIADSYNRHHLSVVEGPMFDNPNTGNEVQLKVLLRGNRFEFIKRTK